MPRNLGLPVGLQNRGIRQVATYPPETVADVRTAVVQNPEHAVVWSSGHSSQTIKGRR